MSKRRISYGLFTLLMILAISVTAFAALTETRAREIAEQWMPAGTDHRLTKAEEHEFEVYFYNDTLKTSYKVEVSKATELITEISAKVQNARGSDLVNLNEAQVKAIVLQEFPDAAIYRIKLDTEDHVHVYEVKFTSGSSRGEMNINPEDGAIIDWEIKY